MNVKTRVVISLCASIIFVSSISIAAQYDAAVHQAQKTLKMLGYNPGAIDGLWGKATRKAVEKFQQDKGLPVTGELDAETKKVLKMLINEKQESNGLALKELTLEYPIDEEAYPSNEPIIITQKNDNSDYTVNGKILHAFVGFENNVAKFKAILYANGSLHKIVGRVKMYDDIFESEQDDPMIFQCVYGKGYVYKEGKGKITIGKTGEIFRMGY